ncbi:P63C domain-containing protein [Ferruginibacter lapsinanis]|uniref:P63C domain-containing protein n=1 Tax=Ferruginibacter lapsinanis TaxID=563172 RepID=UPI001E6403F2|nr:P63C domain-containing protein [Ferruginibacter lapsinanis]UEG49730.1 P63C domain-containing protein [Ferruginibacter lapsinanis]
MSNIIKATHEGEITIGTANLKVAVLSNRKRIITQSAIFEAFGRPMRGSRSLADQDVPKLPGLIDAKNLKPFISNELYELIKVVEYEDLKGKRTDGYDATILPLICEVYVDARNAIKSNGTPVLTTKQMPNVFAAETVLRALAKVGIIGLVDEVTGYQEERDKNALQEFLSRFIKEQRGVYMPTYPDDFFEALFKMRGLNWSLANKGKKPQYFGHLLNNYVYERIGPKVLEELRRVSPKDEVTGKRKGKYTQYIDEKYGHPKLKDHLMILTAFAKAAGYNWNAWERMVNKALPKFGKDGSQIQELGFEEE